MDLSQYSQFGMAGIFIAACYMLYKDMRQDSLQREKALMEHMDKVTDTLDNVKDAFCEVKDTLTNINERLKTVEEFVRKD